MGAAPRTCRLSKRTVDSAGAEAKAYRLWDTELRGFGLKVTPRGIKTYFVWYRAGEGRRAPLREYTIARHGVMAPDEARLEAGRVLGRVRLGQDPQAQRKRARTDITVEGLCDLYLAEGAATKKETTLRTDTSRIQTHIKPLLGKRPASQVTQQDVARFLREVAGGKTAAKQKPTQAEVRAARQELRGLAAGHAPSPVTAQLLRAHGVELGSEVVAYRRAAKALASIETRGRKDAAGRGGRGTATRTLGLLGSIFSFAVREGVRPDNPVTGVDRFKDNQSQRYLSQAELGRLANALNKLEAEGANRSGLLVIRLLTLTGARKGEIEGLRWEEVDHGRAMLRLADSKTGARVIPLGAAATACLTDIDATPGSPFVFPAAGDPTKHYVGTPRVWEKVKLAAALSGVRLHDLRHTFASYGAADGLSLPLIGALLGHRDVKTTSQYAHLADDPLRMAAERTSAAISGAMAGDSATTLPMRAGASSLS